MVLNNSENDINKSATNDLAKKIKLENSLKPSILKMFKSVADDFAVYYKVTGQIIDLEYCKSELIGILRIHYRKCVKDFKKTIRNQLFKSYDLSEFKESIEQEIDVEKVRAEEERTDNKIDEILIAFLLLLSFRQAEYILKTTKNDLYNNVQDVIVEAVNQGVNPTNVEIAEKAKQRFLKSSKERIDTIATTETNQISEKTKFTEAEILNASNIILSDRKFKKKWHAVLDEVTRKWHASVDGQVRNLEDPFIVNGERLMHPSDTSLGASSSNIINCRCGSVTIIE